MICIIVLPFSMGWEQQQRHRMAKNPNECKQQKYAEWQQRLTIVIINVYSVQWESAKGRKWTKKELVWQSLEIIR